MELVEIIYSKLSDYPSYKNLYDSCRAIREENPHLFLEYMTELNERVKEKLAESEDKRAIISLYELLSFLYLYTLAAKNKNDNSPYSR